MVKLHCTLNTSFNTDIDFALLIFDFSFDASRFRSTVSKILVDGY